MTVCSLTKCRDKFVSFSFLEIGCEKHTYQRIDSKHSLTTTTNNISQRMRLVMMLDLDIDDISMLLFKYF